MFVWTLLMTLTNINDIIFEPITATDGHVEKINYRKQVGCVDNFSSTSTHRQKRVGGWKKVKHM